MTGPKNYSDPVQILYKYAVVLTSFLCFIGAYTTRCDFKQGLCDWKQSTEDDFNWSRRRG